MVKKKVKKEVVNTSVCESCGGVAEVVAIKCHNCDNDAQGTCDNCSDPYCYDCFDEHLRDYIGLTPLTEETTLECQECGCEPSDCDCLTEEEKEEEEENDS